MTEKLAVSNPGAELTEALNDMGITTVTRQQATHHIVKVAWIPNGRSFDLVLTATDGQLFKLSQAQEVSYRALKTVGLKVEHGVCSLNGKKVTQLSTPTVNWFVTFDLPIGDWPLTVADAQEAELPEPAVEPDEFEGNAAAMAAAVLDDEPAIVDDTPAQKQAMEKIAPMLGLKTPEDKEAANKKSFQEWLADWNEARPGLKSSTVCEILHIARPGEWDWTDNQSVLKADDLVGRYFSDKEKPMENSKTVTDRYDTETGEVIDTALSTVTDALPIVSENEIAEQRLAQVKAKQAMLQRIRAEIMLKDTHYGIIQGTKTPTLLKPGAELLSDFFGLSIDTEATKIVDRDYDWTNNRFYVRYRVALISNGLSVSAEGSCSSEETKYRWRQGKRVCPKCSKESIRKSKYSNNGEEPGWYCNTKEEGCGAQYVANDRSIVDQQVGRVENPDKADLLNTLEKMSYKRAFVAAVLVATGASGMFTQDLEDNA